MEERLKLEHYFPTTIGTVDCPFIDEIKEPYKKIISKFKYEPSGFCHERVHQNKNFRKLNTWILKQIHAYARKHLYADYSNVEKLGC